MPTSMTTLWRVAPPKRYPKTKHCLARGHMDDDTSTSVVWHQCRYMGMRQALAVFRAVLGRVGTTWNGRERETAPQDAEVHQ